MAIIRAVFRIIIGILFGAGSAIALIPAFAAFTTEQDSNTPIIMVTLILLCGAICFFAPTIRRAFGRGFLLLGAAVFALPISTFLFSGRAVSEVLSASEEGGDVFVAAGAGLAGVAVTGIATFLGVIIGAILLLVGLVLSLGGRREVIIVEVPTRIEPTINK